MKKILFMLFVLFSFSITNVNAKNVMDYSVGDEIKFNPISNNMCETGKNCYTFQVISRDSSLNEIDIMMKQNLVNDVLWAGYDDTSKLGCTSQSTGCCWYGPITALKALKEATDSWNVEYVSSDKNISVTPSSSGTIYDTYNIDYTKYKARLITSDEILNLCGGSANMSNNNCPSWLTSTISTENFWTSTGYSSDRAYYFGMGNGTYLYGYYINYQKAGIRPVITITDQSMKEDISIQNNNVIISGNYKVIEKIEKFTSVIYDQNSDAYKKLQEIFSNKKSIVAYSFNLYDENNNLVEPETKVTVNVKLPTDMNSEKISLWYVTEEFNKEELEYTISDNILSFETDHFSTYVLTEDTDVETVNVADTALNTMKLGITIGLVILVLGVMVIVQTLLKDKKKNQ